MANRRLKRQGLQAAVLVVLGGAGVWLSQRESGPPLRTPLLASDPAQADSILLTNAHGTVSLKRGPDDWMLDSGWPVDPSLLAGFVENVGKARRGVILGDPPKFSEVGLQPPDHRLTITWGQRRQTVVVGRRSGFDGRAYGAEEVEGGNLGIAFRVPGDLLFHLGISPETFRSRRLIHDSDTIWSSVTLAQGDFRWWLQRSDGHWQWAPPAGTLGVADSERSDRLISGLFHLRASRFLEAGPEPWQGVRVASVSAGDRRWRLEFGPGPTPERLLVRVSGPDTDAFFCEVPASKIEAVWPRGDHFFADRRVLILDHESVERLKLTTPEGTVELARLPVGWGFSDGDPASAARVEGLLVRLTHIRSLSERSRGNKGIGDVVATIEIVTSSRSHRIRLGQVEGSDRWLEDSNGLNVRVPRHLVDDLPLNRKKFVPDTD